MTDAGAPFLGVARSLTGRRWRERPADPAVTRAHQAESGLSEPVARALAARGVRAHEAGAYMAPTLRAQFPDPSSFAGMDASATALVEALERDTPMTVFADYDVDGATSAAQLVRWYRHMGKEIPIYVPDRLVEGYGPSPAAFRSLRDQGVELVVTVDCGAAAQDALAAAGEIGLGVVVIDHHLMRAAPSLDALLVNPNRPDCTSGQGALAAAGVTFVLLAALSREARRRGLFSDRQEPDLKRWLDLAALGAICDVTQLTGFNRALTAQGLKVMSAWGNPGLAALMDAAGAKREAATTYTAGFILGPRINAGGRIGRSDLGARLLSTDDPAEASALAMELDALNASRREVERRITEEAIAAIERGANFDPKAPAIVVAHDGWHPGVIGIVAGRLRERYGRPVVVIGIDRAADLGRGSGRSQPGVNLGHAVQEAYAAGLLLSGGGHAMAAGLALRPAAIPEFRDFLNEQLAAETAAAECLLEVDALIGVRAADQHLAHDLQRLAPFGPGAPEPVLALTEVRSERPRILKGGHVRCSLADSGGRRLEAIAWRVQDTELGRRLLAGGGALHIAGRLRRDTWNNRSSVQMEIDDAADPRRI